MKESDFPASRECDAGCSGLEASSCSAKIPQPEMRFVVVLSALLAASTCHAFAVSGKYITVQITSGVFDVLNYGAKVSSCLRESFV